MEQVLHRKGYKSDSICRTCLGDLSGQHHNIFQTPDLKKKLTLCTSLNVEPDDGFPTDICEKCFLKLGDSYEFQQMCIYAMQQYHTEIDTEKSEYTIELAVEKDKLAEHILMLNEPKQEPEDDSLYKEFQDLIELETPAPNPIEEISNTEIPEAKVAEEVLPSEEESDNDSDYNCKESEENDTSNEGSNTNVKTHQSNKTYPNKNKGSSKNPKKKKDFIELEHSTDEELPSKEESDSDPDYNCKESEENDTSNDGSHKNVRTRQSDKTNENKRSSKNAKKKKKDLTDFKHSAQNPAEKIPNIESPEAKVADKELSSEEESDNDPDYNCEKSEQNDTSSDGFNENIKTRQSDNQKSSKNPKKKNPSNPKQLYFVCKICKRRFEKQVMLDSHMRIHEGLNTFPCPDCNKTFVKLHRLGIHIRTIHERKEGQRFACVEQGCGKTYALQQTLATHIRDAHRDAGKNSQKAFVCEVCGKVLTSMATLKNHRFMHTGQELPYECPECHRRCMTSDKLRDHMNRHAGIKNYVCPHCGIRKTTRTELNVHVNFHTREKRYPCKSCPHVYKNLPNLARHVRAVHKGIKEYRCRRCTKLFSKEEARDNHEMTHSEEELYECDICQKKFNQYLSMSRHMKKHSMATEIISSALARAQARVESTET